MKIKTDYGEALDGMVPRRELEDLDRWRIKERLRNKKYLKKCSPVKAAWLLKYHFTDNVIPDGVLPIWDEVPPEYAQPVFRNR